MREIKGRPGWVKVGIKGTPSINNVRLIDFDPALHVELAPEDVSTVAGQPEPVEAPSAKSVLADEVSEDDEPTTNIISGYADEDDDEE